MGQTINGVDYLPVCSSAPCSAGEDDIITDMVNSPLPDIAFRGIATVWLNVLNNLRAERVYM